jgi:hypothetical protein
MREKTLYWFREGDHMWLGEKKGKTAGKIPMVKFKKLAGTRVIHDGDILMPEVVMNHLHELPEYSCVQVNSGTARKSIIGLVLAQMKDGATL